MADALQIAMEHHRAARLAEAEAGYRQLLASTPREPRLLHLLGTLMLQRGNFADAIALLRSVITIAPDALPSWFALAQALRLSGKFADAEAAANRAIAIKPDFAPAYNELGLALINQEKAESAINSWRRAIALKPDYAEALCNLGAALAQKEQFAQAATMLRTAAQLLPNHAPAHNNLANVLDEQKRTDEAIPHWRRALELQPNFFDALINLGKTIHQRGQYHEAMALFNRALAIKPNDPHARFLRGLVLLVHGQLREGFVDYEHRFASPHFNLAARTFPQPRWNGGPNSPRVAGKTILLHAEQGLGDTIQFVRYAPLLAERGATVIIESPAELTALLRTVPKVHQVITRGEALPPFDCHASVVSLPLLFGTTLESIPASAAYISAPSDRQCLWSDVLGEETGTLRVGLVWAGNPKHSNDAARSIPLRVLAPALAKLSGVTFYSLQKGPAAQQLHDPGIELEMIDDTDDLHDFADTAALVSQLDLVITVDTSVAHLAGAMGKPVALLLAHVPDWRWLLDRDDSPWYPTMTLFRQPRRGDWQSVAQAVAEAVQRDIDQTVRV